MPAGNMRHLIVEACIARNLLDISAYAWPGYVNARVNQIPRLSGQVTGWSSLMKGSPLTSALMNALVSSPASRYNASLDIILLCFVYHLIFFVLFFIFCFSFIISMEKGWQGTIVYLYHIRLACSPPSIVWMFSCADCALALSIWRSKKCILLNCPQLLI